MRAIPLILVALTFTSCQDPTIDPFNNDGKLYTIYGFLDERSMFHEVRVIPITRQSARIDNPESPQAEIDATVTTTDLTSGAKVQWQHSLRQLSGGEYGHVYSAQIHVFPDHRYRLEVVRNDGRSATAETTIPYLSSTVVDRSSPYVRDDSVRQQIRIAGVNSVWAVNVMYYLDPGVRLPRGRAGRRDGSDWVFEVNLDADIDRLAAHYSISRDAVLFAAMGVNIRVLDDQWTPPGDVFDPEVLAQPGAFGNVENGYGYFGSVGVLQIDWPLSQELVDALGF